MLDALDKIQEAFLLLLFWPATLTYMIRRHRSFLACAVVSGLGFWLWMWIAHFLWIFGFLR